MKELVEGEDKDILRKLFNNVLNLEILEIEYDKNIGLSNMSEYEFELVKIKALIKNREEIEIYLKTIKNSKIKESIFCYWCAIYEEELAKARELDNMDVIVNKVSISELDKSKYQQSIFLTIEDNKTPILQTGTEVNFVEVIDYIEDLKDKNKKLNNLYKYFEKDSNDVLLVGIKKDLKNRKL